MDPNEELAPRRKFVMMSNGDHQWAVERSAPSEQTRQPQHRTSEYRTKGVSGAEYEIKSFYKQWPTLSEAASLDAESVWSTHVPLKAIADVTKAYSTVAQSKKEL